MSHGPWAIVEPPNILHDVANVDELDELAGKRGVEHQYPNTPKGGPQAGTGPHYVIDRVPLRVCSRVPCVGSGELF